jgi:hypothetical protein
MGIQPECVNLGHGLHWALFWKVHKNSNLKLQKNSKKIWECNQWFILLVYKFSI